MEQTEILEGNRLIAEFMGLKVELNYEDNTVVKGNKMLTASANKIEPFVYIQPTFMHVAPLDSKTAIEEMVTQKIWRNIERLSKYHLSWDWIMPVIEKIEKQGYYTNILSADNDSFKHTVHITPLDDDEQYTLWCNSKIEAVWIGVVEFIKAEINNVQPNKELMCGKGQNIA